MQEKYNSNNYWKYQFEPSVNQKDTELETINETKNVYVNSELEAVYELEIADQLEMVYEFESVYELDTFDQLDTLDPLEAINEESANDEAVSNDESIVSNKSAATNETKTDNLYTAKNVRERFVLIEDEEDCQVLTCDESRSGENLKERKSYINIESLECLAVNYIKENDTENIYIILNTLIQMGSTRLAVNYAVSLYRKKYYKQSFNYFKILSQFNHPIAKYFIGIMMFYGLGCEKSREESYNVLKYLSDNNIDRATEFIQEHFK